ncbi:unnamed protein product [Knipowitschia caucasica]
MTEGNCISVWVCREEKLVLGLSKRTSCADVIQVLLTDQDPQMGLYHAPQSYCIVEKWRGFERVLPNKTKIWRLWLAWDQEQKDVKFVLVKCDASLPSHAPRSAEARVVRSEQSECVTSGTTAASGVCPEKQRRIVRKAFRKLEKINKRRVRKDASCAERMETLVHLVLSQDHTIRQQVHRLQELDTAVELYEAKVHLERVQRHGANYVQDTYLENNDNETVKAEKLCSNQITLFEDYVATCEAVGRLQEEIRESEAQIDRVRAQIQQELQSSWMQRQVHLHGPLMEEEEEERLKTQLEASWYIGLRLDTDLGAVRGDLKIFEDKYTTRMQELVELLQEVNALDLTDVQSSVGTGRPRVDNYDVQTEWVEQARGLSKVHHLNDDDSDTGLSSLHSLDSDPAQWEAVV